MSATTFELIGRIINPAPRTEAPAKPAAPPAATESVSILIGRIIAPAGRGVRRVEPAPAESAEPAAAR